MLKTLSFLHHRLYDYRVIVRRPNSAVEGPVGGVDGGHAASSDGLKLGGRRARRLYRRRDGHAAFSDGLKLGLSTM